MDAAPGLEPPIIQPVAQRYITELSRLLSSVSVSEIITCHFSTEGKRPLGRPRRRWEDNIRVVFEN
jgi:hypothetical protein